MFRLSLLGSGARVYITMGLPLAGRRSAASWFGREALQLHSRDSPVTAAGDSIAFEQAGIEPLGDGAWGDSAELCDLAGGQNGLVHLGTNKKNGRAISCRSMKLRSRLETDWPDCEAR